MKEKLIEDFPNYMIREDGTVLSSYKPKTGLVWDKWTALSNVLDSTGYFIVTVRHGGVKRNKSIHRLLCLAFKPNPNNYPHVNHINGIKTDNSLDNLEWCSAKHNSQHAVDLGLTEPAYEKTRKAILQLGLEGTLIAEHVSIHEAARATGVAYQNISKVVRGLRKTAGGFKWEYLNV